MLPFIKPKSFGAGGPITSVKSSDFLDGDAGDEAMEKEHSEGIMSASSDLIHAVHAKDAKGVADALKAHHEMKISEDFLSEPESEG